MSGPTYPKDPRSGQNFIEGRATFDVEKTIISQYANSDRLAGIIRAFAKDVDQTATLDAFYNLVMNLDTAQGYGLDCWGRIVGVNRVLQVTNTDYFGFAEAGDALPFGDARFTGYEDAFGFAEAGDASPFGQAPFGLHPIYLGVDPNAGGGVFYAGGAITSNYSTADQLYRTLIYAKAMANITSGSIPDINRILLYIFAGRGNCYVQEQPYPDYFGFAEAGDAQPFGQAPLYAGGGLSRLNMTYVFTFPLTAIDLAIVAQSGVLPSPAGRSVSIVAPGY